MLLVRGRCWSLAIGGGSRCGACWDVPVECSATGPEDEAGGRGAFNAEVAGVVLAMMGRTQGGEVLGVVGPTVSNLLQVVEVDE